MARLSRPSYRIGEVSPVRWMTVRRLGLVAVLVAAALAGLVVLVLVRSLAVLLVEIALVVLVLVAMRQRDATGGFWLSTVLGQGVRRWISERARWDEFDPRQEERPFGLEHLQLRAWSPGSEEAGEMAFVDGGGDGYVAMVFEVSGAGEGVRSAAEHVQLERVLPDVLRALSEPRFSVEQIDCLTRVVPDASHAYEDWLGEHLRPSTPPVLRENLETLTLQAARASQQLRSYLVVRMPESRLVDDAQAAGLTDFPAALFEAGWMTAADVARVMEQRGLEAVRALSAREYCALVRAMWIPSQDTDDAESLPERFWPGQDETGAWPAYAPTPTQDAVVAEDPQTGDRWWHSTAVVPRSGWPTEPVFGRWLEPLVLTSPVSHRTVQVSLRLVSQQTARSLAKSRLTSAAAERIRRRRSGAVATGEEEQVESVAQLVTQDVSTRGESGVVAAVRVSVAGPTLRQVRRDREQLESSFLSSMNGQQLTWEDGRQVPAFLQLLPLGRSVQP